ncbi:hypothetical protein PENTCL1PPCAC_6553 [Pristionchus entomophagus]|uniref:AAA+ ATPase domain-containing protein n=1 Tax=Pristionchus entomophagus TaxID=358040 RepID=A0AAV5SMP7_9BILA|nr:hypothetical protein PENTCL1PPCAC_6553 [Pristionchus entomophagus]
MLTDETLVHSLSKCMESFTIAASSGQVPSIETLYEMISRSKSVASILPAVEANEHRHSMLQTIIATLEITTKQMENGKREFVRELDGDEQMDTSDDKEKLDSFAASRKNALEATIVTNIESLPLLSDIMGLKEAKEALLEALVDPLLYPEWFEQSNISPWRCVLLFGPPGTGKSALCGAIAREVNARFYTISSSDLISSWSGQSEKLIRSLFDIVLANEEPSIIFMDEVDSLCRKRNTNEDDANRRVKTELLVQISRLQSSKSRVFLISATNCPWDLDPAFLRRFEKKIYIGLPDSEAREALFAKLLERTEMSAEVSWKWLSSVTEGHSGDDIRRLSNEIAFAQFRLYKAAKKIMDTTTRKMLNRDEISGIISKSPPTVSREYVRQFESYAN